MFRILLFLFIAAIAFSCSGPSGEEQMLSLLQKEREEFYNPLNNFSGEAKLYYTDSIIKTIKGFVPTSLLLLKSDALLELGRTKEALDVLEEIRKKDSLSGTSLKVRLREKLALAYLRLGEQTNCINNHSSESCIFPVMGKGIHTDPFGSAKALSLFEELVRENPNDLESRWLLNIASMTLGKYSAEASNPFLIPDLNRDSSYGVKPFQDIAGDLHMDIRNMCGGSIIEDFNDDGYLDVVTSGWGLEEAMHFFRNNADGTFSDVSEESGLKKFTGGLNMMQTDYNNDGHKDIFVTRGGWQAEFGAQPNSLLRNNGDGTFTDVTIDAGLLSFHPTQTATWNDFNNDGWLDVFIGNETHASGRGILHPCELYINNQDGTFTEMADKAGCNFTHYVKGVTSGDYNNDGWKDIFISTLNGAKVLLKNKGVRNSSVVFEDVTREALLDRINNRTFPTWFWDYDNDGWLDIFVCDYTFKKSLAHYSAAYSLNLPEENIGQPSVYRNNRNGTFTNVTRELGLHKPAFAMGSNFGDINNDGFLDMFLGTGNPDYKSLVPNKMFLNLDGKKFADVTTAAKVGSLQKGHGVAFGDMDNDGDQDIYIEMGGAYLGDAYQSSFYLNPGQSDNNWICISLEGDKANKCAIGSRLKLTFRENGKIRSVYRDVNSGGSFGSSTFRREIGLGKAAVIDELEVIWHGGGTVQKFKNVAVNQFIKIREGDSDIERINLKKLTFRKQTQKPHCGSHPVKVIESRVN